MIFKIMVIVFVAFSVVQMLEGLPDLRLNKRVAARLRIVNLSSHNANEKMSAAVELPCGIHYLSARNFQQVFALDDFAIPHNLKLAVTYDDVRSPNEVLVSVLSGDGVSFRGDAIAPGQSVRLANNSGMRIRTQQDKEIAILFEFI